MSNEGLNGGLVADAAPDIVVAKIGRVHGIKGWLRLISFTTPAENISQHSKFGIAGEEPKTLELEAIKQQSKGFIALFKGHNTPESARTLTGKELTISSQALPKLPEGDFYWHQLEGLQVVNLQSCVFGKVQRLMETGANDVLVVQASDDSIDDRQRLIPYLMDRVVQQVDLQAGVITVDWQADYLE